MWPRPPGRLHLVGPEFRFFKDKTTLMWCSSQTRNHFQKFRVEHTPRKILTKKIPKKMGFWNKYHLSNHESWLFGSIYVRVSRVFFLTPTIMVQFEVSPPSVPRCPQHLPGMSHVHPGKPTPFRLAFNCFQVPRGWDFAQKNGPRLEKDEASNGGWFPGEIMAKQC